MNNPSLLLEIADTYFDPQAEFGNHNDYKIRRAARGILIKDDRIALLNVSKQDFHKLPGGGIEEGETVEEGFGREILEETGCECEISRKLGMVIEWRGKFQILQINYIYAAKVSRDTGKLSLEGDEVAEGFQLEWVEKSKILDKIAGDNTEEYESKFIVKRDCEIIKHYLNNEQN